MVAKPRPITLKEAHQVVVHAVEGLNTQEHKEQRQEECDDGAEGGKRDGDLDAADEEVAALVGHVDQARQKSRWGWNPRQCSPAPVDKRHDAAVDKEDRRNSNDNITAQARAATEALGSKRRLFAIVVPVHKLGDQRRRRHDEPRPQDRPKAILEHARGGQEAQRRGVALLNARPSAAITLVPRYT